jgi:hypothetical protein
VTNIAGMWRQHFDELYNSVVIGDEMNTLSGRIMNDSITSTLITSLFMIYVMHAVSRNGATLLVWTELLWKLSCMRVTDYLYIFVCCSICFWSLVSFLNNVCSVSLYH